MRRIVLFGGSGFLGSRILSRLQQRSVIAPARSRVDLTSLSDVTAFLQPGDLVINAAGYAESTARTPGEVARLDSENVTAVATLVEAAAGVGIGRLIHMSSVAAMGRLLGAEHDEESIGPILSPYALSKYRAELLLDPLRSKLPVTTLRPTSVFGEGRGLTRALCRVCQLQVIPLPGGGRALIPFTYVGNVVEAVAIAVESADPLNGTYIVGDDSSYPLRQIVLTLSHHLGSNARVVPVPAWGVRALLAGSRAVGGRRAVLDDARIATLTTSVSYSIRRFREATGYRPIHTIDGGLRNVARWYAAGAAPIQ